MKIQHVQVPYQQLYPKFVQPQNVLPSIVGSHPLNFMPKVSTTAGATLWWYAENCQVCVLSILQSCCCSIIILFVTMRDNGGAIKILHLVHQPHVTL